MMEAGRRRNIDTKMRGNINDEGKLTDNYLPRKCDYSDRIITPDDSQSVQINICSINEDGTINLKERNQINLCGYVRAQGYADVAIAKVMKEKKI